MRNSTQASIDDRAGHRGPADHRREGAGGAADDDVLRRRALQPHRVDDGVKEDGEGEEPGGEPVGGEAERSRPRSPSSTRPSDERVLARDAAGGDRPVGGAAHHRVDVGVVPHVEGARGPCPDGDAEDGDDAENGIDAARREQQADERGEDDKRHHPRLQEREVVLYPRPALGNDRCRCHRQEPIACPCSPLSGARTSCGSWAASRTGGTAAATDRVHSSVVAPSPHGLAGAGRFFRAASKRR